MFKSISSALLLSYFSQTSQSSYVATFQNNGVSGTVTVTEGTVSVDIDLSSFDPANYPTGDDSCISGGMKYHIHDKWTWSDTQDRLTSECASDYCGGHWDPWLGCGSNTGNAYCSAKGFNESCVPGSSVLSSTAGYDCSDTNFAINPYSCEVGDWNGKYGLLTLDSDSKLIAENSSPFEVSPQDLAELSVVFHCTSTGGPRVFCAPFVEDTTVTSTRPTQSTQTSQAATFSTLSDDSMVILESDGTYSVYFDTSAITVPSGCTTLLYRIYNNWNAGDATALEGESACLQSVVGDFYDPTVSCAEDSDSDYCDGGLRCDDVDYVYTCDSSMYGDERFDCAPGDLSGKYGSFSIADGSPYSKSGSDDLMIPLDLLSGKSVVLQCADYTVVACAAFEDYIDGTTPAPTDGATQLGVTFAFLMGMIGIMFQ